MTALTVTPINPPTITAWLITPATAADVMTALATAAGQLKYRGTALCYPDAQTGAPTWMITLSLAGYPDQIGYEHDWIVFNGDTASIIAAADMPSIYTANTAITWAATSAAPQASAGAANTATIEFPAPTSLNGPFTYTATQTDSTTNTTEAASLTGSPVASPGGVELTAVGLPVGDTVSFTITVTTPYDGVTATSQPTNAITVTA